MSSTEPAEQRPLAFLRNLARQRDALEHCELCSAALAAEHQHLIEPVERRLLCSCDACAILFTGQTKRFRRVPRRIEFLPDLQLTDAQWEELHLPINLAFFFHSSPARRVIAVYPSPAGATESLLALDAWQRLEEENPLLRQLEPDVEALLVNRIGQSRNCYRVPIDECYKLVGIMRKHWRGLGGGTAVWEQTAQFFASLRERSNG
jgi:hypothetical protein